MISSCVSPNGPRSSCPACCQLSYHSTVNARHLLWVRNAWRHFQQSPRRLLAKSMRISSVLTFTQFHWTLFDQEIEQSRWRPSSQSPANHFCVILKLCNMKWFILIIIVLIINGKSYLSGALVREPLIWRESKQRQPRPRLIPKPNSLQRAAKLKKKFKVRVKAEPLWDLPSLFELRRKAMLRMNNLRSFK
jgi:hypothetical protein